VSRECHRANSIVEEKEREEEEEEEEEEGGESREIPFRSTLPPARLSGRAPLPPIHPGRADF